ncbi:VOC family protein [Salipiger thiooxidans]|uniref:VOC family protein n=1 Tax=Salipiger thiooxidans TaxID=282683 RepID=UPI001F5CEE87|nr:VOC family protein [Salipiger thiooxidans]
MGRRHHVSYATDQREDILRAADIFLLNGVHIETGSHKHAIQGTYFLYVWEPAGNRVELASAGARRVLAPALAAGEVDPGGPDEGAGPGAEDHRVVPHRWTPAGGALRCLARPHGHGTGREEGALPPSLRDSPGIFGARGRTGGGDGGCCSGRGAGGSSAGWWRPRATRPRCASTCATPARSPPPAFSPPADG